LGAGLVERAIPRGEGARRRVIALVAAAAEEDLPAARAALGEVADLASRAVHADGDRLAGLALGVAGAGHEAPEAAALDDHRLAALLALLVGDLFGHGDDLAV